MCHSRGETFAAKSIQFTGVQTHGQRFYLQQVTYLNYGGDTGSLSQQADFVSIENCMKPLFGHINGRESKLPLYATPCRLVAEGGFA